MEIFFSASAFAVTTKNWEGSQMVLEQHGISQAHLKLPSTGPNGKAQTKAAVLF